jgi:hypothetical protein
LRKPGENIGDILEICVSEVEGRNSESSPAFFSLEAPEFSPEKSYEIICLLYSAIKSQYFLRLK